MMSSKRKTIMHLISTGFFGGPEKQIIEHLTRLNTSHYRGVVASFLEYGRPNETLEMAKIVGLPHHGIPMSGPLDVRAQWKLNRLLRQEQVDLLCAHGYKSCVMGWWAGLRLTIPVIAFSRGYTTEDIKVAFYEWLERRVLERLAGIIFVSEAQKKKLESYGIQGQKSWIVHNTVSVNESSIEQPEELRKIVCERLGIPKSSKIVVTAGRMSPEKGHRYLIDAIAQMGKRSNGVSFIFCGDGRCQKDLEKQAQDLGIYDKCRFPGFRRDLREIFQVMDVMALPSLTEGLPNVILEAFAYAKPVVATNVGGVPEIVEDGVNGILVPPKRPDLLAQAITRCLADASLMRSLGEAGHRKVKSEFTFESQTRKLEEIYSEVLSR